MTTNRMKDRPVTEEKNVDDIQRKKSSGRKKVNINSVFKIFGVFNRHQVVHYMPFILFLSFLIFIYIANSYYAERMIREIDKIKTDLKEKRAEYISTKSQLMYQKNQSQIAKLLQPYQIKEITEPPDKIFIPQSTKNKLSLK